MEKKDNDILFECEKLQEIDRKIELWNILLTQMWIVIGHPVLMAYTDFIGERIYAGAGICWMGIQY